MLQPPDRGQHVPRQPRRGGHPRPHHLRPGLHTSGEDWCELCVFNLSIDIT